MTRHAWCYWIGKPMPWIRHQALASFKRHHPDWTLAVATTDAELVAGRLGAVDWIYEAALKLGDAAATTDSAEGVVSCGVIAARPGSAVMSAFLEESRSMIARDEKGWHDNLAALAAARALRNRRGLRLSNLPAQFFYPFSPLHEDQRRWWNSKERLPAMPLLAAHWYGGGSHSRELAPALTADNWQERQGPIFEALRLAGTA